MSRGVTSNNSASSAWPALPVAEWQDTYVTLHRWMQIVGKTRLARAPMQNHWWHTALYLTTRGIGTSPMPDGTRTVEVEFDFIDHVLIVRTSDGASRTIPLVPRTVAEFYAAYVSALDALGIASHIWPVPMELSDTLRFDADRVHASYDADAAHRCWQALAQADRVFKVFRGGFLGKSNSREHLSRVASRMGPAVRRSAACSRSGRGAPCVL